MSCSNRLRHAAADTRFWLVGLVAVILITAGCASTRSETSIPWNTPQSWEGAPYLPGLSQ